MSNDFLREMAQRLQPPAYLSHQPIYVDEIGLPDAPTGTQLDELTAAVRTLVEAQTADAAIQTRRFRINTALTLAAVVVPTVVGVVTVMLS